MEPNAFVGKTKEPTQKELSSALGTSYELWETLVDDLGLTGEWNSYSPKAGWSLKLKQRKRTILYLGPCDGCFRAAFVLGDKAIAAARASDLPNRVLKLIDEAKKYPEGTAVRFENVKPADIPAIKKLTAIKMAS